MSYYVVSSWAISCTGTSSSQTPLMQAKVDGTQRGPPMRFRVAAGRMIPADAISIGSSSGSESGSDSDESVVESRPVRNVKPVNYGPASIKKRRVQSGDKAAAETEIRVKTEPVAESTAARYHVHIDDVVALSLPSSQVDPVHSNTTNDFPSLVRFQMQPVSLGSTSSPATEAHAHHVMGAIHSVLNKEADHTFAPILQLPSVNEHDLSSIFPGRPTPQKSKPIDGSWDCGKKSASDINEQVCSILERGDIEGLRAFMQSEKGANIRWELNDTSDDHWTIPFWALPDPSRPDSEIPLRARLLRTMVQLRVPLYTRSFRGTSMLDYCAVRHLLDFALVLIEGAAPSAAYTASRHTAAAMSAEQLPYIDDRDVGPKGTGRTALHWAVLHSCKQVVRSLLNARAHPALPDNTADRCTPIHYAIRRFDLDAPFRLDTADILNAILHQDQYATEGRTASVLFNVPNAYGNTALHEACLVFSECARVCLQYNEFDPWLLNRFNQLPLDLALVSKRRARDVAALLALPQPAEGAEPPKHGEPVVRTIFHVRGYTDTSVCHRALFSADYRLPFFPPHPNATDMRGMVPKVEHYSESSWASECDIDQLPPPDLMEQETLRAAIEAACQSQTVHRNRFRELLLRAVRLSCPEAALTILQRFPVGAMLRHEASQLCESVVKGWELLVSELRTSMSNRRDTSQRDYVVSIGERKVNLRELDHRVEIEMLELMPPERHTPTQKQSELGFLPFELHELMPRECILHKQELTPKVSNAMRNFNPIVRRYTGVVDSNGVLLSTPKNAAKILERQLIGQDLLLRQNAQRRVVIGRLTNIAHPILRMVLRFERLKDPRRALSPDGDLCVERENEPNFFQRLPPAFGLFAREDIPKDTLLMEYAGEVFDYGEWTTAPPKRDQAGYSMDIEPMESAVPTHTASPTASSALPSPTDRFWFKLDAIFRGNEVRFINDYRDFSQLNLQEAFAAAENVHLGQVKENCEFMSVYFKGWQHSVVKVKKHITAGQELLVDYGVNYWLTYLPQMFTELHSLEIANLKQQLQELGQARSSSSSM